MNMLRKLTPFYRTACTRLLETATNIKETLHTPDPGRRLVIEPLSDRELVRVQGEEVVPFLQGLITNDMYHLQEVKCGEGEVNPQLSSMYTMFLNKAGRVLYDSIIYRTPNPSTYLIECDKCISNELRRHLRMYRVRRKIQIDTIDREFTPWIAFNPDMGYDDNICIPNANSRFAADVYSAPDPRARDLGLRILTTPDRTWRDLSKLFAQPGKVNVIAPSREMNYRLHRYRCGVGEGVYDLPPGKCFPLEANGDFLHGVSFHKGCYIGQELTARVYHTGVVRKRLLPLRLTMPLKEQEATVKSQAGANVGIVRGVSFNRALALLRVDQALHSPGLMVDGEPCYVEKPRWWPVEMSSKARISEG